MPSDLALTRTVSAVFVLLVVLGPVALLMVPSAVLVPGDPVATAEALARSSTLLRVGVLSEAVIATSEVVMAVALYSLFRAAGPVVAMVSAGARLVMAGLQGLGAALGFALVSASPSTLLDHGLLLLELREGNVLAWQLFFGMHCVTLGWLVWRSGRVPAALGALMGMAGVAYLAQSLVVLVLPDAVDAVRAVAPVGILLGEVPLFLWLMLRGAGAVESAAWAR